MRRHSYVWHSKWILQGARIQAAFPYPAWRHVTCSGYRRQKVGTKVPEGIPAHLPSISTTMGGSGDHRSTGIEGGPQCWSHISPRGFCPHRTAERDVEGHSLHLYREGDLRSKLARAALYQEFIAEAPVDIVVCALYQRTSWRYGRRAERYAHMEAGHVGQNIHLQAVTLGLATVMVGAFHNEEVNGAMALSKGVAPLYIVPVGRSR